MGENHPAADLGRYTHRVAIANSRLVSLAEGRVSFRWKDYRHHDKQKVMTLGADEFIRRFLLHVLPDGFHRIRHYGYLANGGRAAKLAHCRRLLAVPEPAPTAPAADYRERYQQLTGRSIGPLSVMRRPHDRNRRHSPYGRVRRCGFLEHLMIPCDTPSQPSVLDSPPAVDAATPLALPAASDRPYSGDQPPIRGDLRRN